MFRLFREKTAGRSARLDAKDTPRFEDKYSRQLLV